MQNERLTHQFRSIGKLNTRDEASDEYKISGYFIVFNSETKLGEGMFEEVAPEALVDVDLSDVRALADHDTAKVLGRTKSKTLELSVDDKGLYGEISINQNDTDAVNLYERVKRGDISQCSFGFDILEEDYEQRENGVKWTIRKIKLYEISVVSFPAYEDTAVSARSQQVKQIEQRQLEQRKAKLKERIQKWH